MAKKKKESYAVAWVEQGRTFRDEGKKKLSSKFDVTTAPMFIEEGDIGDEIGSVFFDMEYTAGNMFTEYSSG